MSTENVSKLLAMAAKDAALRSELEQAGAGEAGAHAVVAIGQKCGLVFTAADIQKAMDAAAEHRGDAPLSDDELAKVSGGRGEYQNRDAMAVEREAYWLEAQMSHPELSPDDAWQLAMRQMDERAGRRGKP